MSPAFESEFGHELALASGPWADVLQLEGHWCVNAWSPTARGDTVTLDSDCTWAGHMSKAPPDHLAPVTIGTS